jgi:hypothetical protein
MGPTGVEPATVEQRSAPSVPTRGATRFRTTPGRYWALVAVSARIRAYRRISACTSDRVGISHPGGRRFESAQQHSFSLQIKTFSPIRPCLRRKVLGTPCSMHIIWTRSGRRIGISDDLLDNPQEVGSNSTQLIRATREIAAVLVEPQSGQDKHGSDGISVSRASGSLDQSSFVSSTAA